MKINVEKIVMFMAFLHSYGNGKIIKEEILLKNNEFDVIINDEPIIGILTQEVGNFLNANYPKHGAKSYLAASYVKFVEGSGGRVVPIWIGQDRSYYENLLSKINGVIFPGGATFFNSSNGYADAGRHIYDIAKNINDNGNFMPIWGACLGFQLLTYLSANSTEHRIDCSSKGQSIPLEFNKGFEKSHMFRSAPSDIIEILRNENVTGNFHRFCVTEKNMKRLGLLKEWKILSSNHDWHNQLFVSSIEHKKYPFYGVQFHPEKNMYEFIQNRNISHTVNAIKTSQYFANFFINQTRKNSNKFLNLELTKSIIYNYSPLFTGKKGYAFEQSYMFDQDDNVFTRRGQGHAKHHSVQLV